MSDLYSYKGAYPYPLPDDMSTYDLNDFVLAPEKPNLLPGQVLEWIDNKWVVRDPNESEIAIKWQDIRELRNRLLSESDIAVLKCYETSTPVPTEIVSYRSALRDITLQANPFDIIWPTNPI